MSEVKVSHSEGEALATITITGNVALAEDLINQQLEQVRRPKSIQWEVRLVDVPQELVGQTIGAGGSNLREMKDKSGCQIAFVQARDYDEAAPEGKQLARIKGPPEKVPDAERLLIEKVQEVQQIHLNKNMSRQMWGAGCGPMPMGGGMDHLGATAWSHWVHNDMGDSMQAAQRWTEDPDGPYNAFEEPQMVEQMRGRWHEDLAAAWQQDSAMGWHDSSTAWYPAAPTKAHDPGTQAVSKSAAVSKLTSHGWPNKRPESGTEDVEAGWDPSARVAASSSTSSRNSGSSGPGPCNNTIAPGLGPCSGSVECVGTKTEVGRSSSSSSRSNRASKNAFHQDKSAVSQATSVGDGGTQTALAIAVAPEFTGLSHSQASEGTRVRAIGTGMDACGAQWPESMDGIEGMDGMDAMEAWARKGKPAIPCRYQIRGPGMCRSTWAAPGDYCAFSHDPEVLSAAMGMGASAPDAEPDDYKMTYCKYWDSGKCSRGALCTFAHGIDELRGGLTPKNLRIMEEAQQMMMAMDPRGPQWPEEALNKDSQSQQATQQDNVPAAFRTAAFQQRLQTNAKGPLRTPQWP